MRITDLTLGEILIRAFAKRQAKHTSRVQEDSNWCSDEFLGRHSGAKVSRTIIVPMILWVEM